MGATVLVKKYMCVCHPYKGHGCSEVLVGILHCMVVRTYQRRREALFGGGLEDLLMLSERLCM